MKNIIFTGPEDSRILSIPRYKIWTLFKRWGSSHAFEDNIADMILQNIGFQEAGFSVTRYFDKYPTRKMEIFRFSAFGDVLQLLIAMGEMGKYRDSGLLVIRTQERYQSLVDYFWRPRPEGFVPDIRVNFDGLAERDQAEERFRNMHRVDIFREALGLPFTQVPKLLNQDLSHFWYKDPTPTPSGEYFIINQMGSRIDNTIDPAIMPKLVEELRKKIKLIQIVAKPESVASDLDIPFVSWTFLFKLLAGAKRLFVTDSGLLWAAHFTRTPVTAMLWNTAPKQRIGYAPANSNSVDLNTLDPNLKRKYAFEKDPAVLAHLLLTKI